MQLFVSSKSLGIVAPVPRSGPEPARDLQFALASTIKSDAARTRKQTFRSLYVATDDVSGKMHVLMKATAVGVESPPVATAFGATPLTHLTDVVIAPTPDREVEGARARRRAEP